MANSGDAFQKQHTVDELIDIDPNKGIRTPEDLGDEETEGGEIDQDIDKLHDETFGDEDKDTISDEIDKDEFALAKDLQEEEQEKSK